MSKPKTKPYVLIVVDMQTIFKASNRPEVRAECGNLVKQAVIDGMIIVFLEYIDNGRTKIPLRRIVRGYDKAYFVEKEDNDGSNELAELFWGMDIPNNFKVCGVNTDMCVFETVQGMASWDRKPKIEVVCKACATHSYGSDYVGYIPNAASMTKRALSKTPFSGYKSLKNVKLV